MTFANPRGNIDFCINEQSFPSWKIIFILTLQTAREKHCGPIKDIEREHRTLKFFKNWK